MIILTPTAKNIEILIKNKKIIHYKGTFKLIQSYKIFIDEISLFKQNTQVNITEEELTKILHKDKVIITKENKNLIKFLQEEKIEYKKKNICHSCIELNKIKLLSKNPYFIGKNKYCKDCVRNFLNIHKNEIPENNYTHNRIEQLLNHYKDITEMFKAIEKDYDPINNPNLTLYDTLPATEQEYDKININQLNLPDKFKQILNKKIQTLLPVQTLAIKNGLLEDENLLIVSATASGKTLIGELSGITKALQKKKMIYLSPLVALANQKYRDFKRDYEKLGLKVMLKVGRNRVQVEDELYVKDESINDADIIVATYEGLDFILRSGKFQDLEELGVVVIDEIQMLENEERGHRLNGLINRLLTLFPYSQLIGLSATIKNASEIASAFGMTLVKYDKRPVKIQRHLLPVTQDDKNKYMLQLCKREFNTISSKNFRGQTIIFTDSRRKTHEISDYLEKKGVSTECYHAGLTYNRKIEIEEAYLNQEISTIVTTSALSSGIDFPASLVIFESLRMGFEWLTPNEFHQMLGRAGRPSYHDLGKVYLLVDEDRQDYIIAKDLLKSDVENVGVLYDVNDTFEQILSDIVAIGCVDISSLEKKYSKLRIPIPFYEAIDYLYDKKMISIDSNRNMAYSTKYGMAVSKSFISPSVAERIKNCLFDDVLDIVLLFEHIHNVYLSKKLVKSLGRVENGYVGSSLYSEHNRKLIFSGSILKYLDDNIQNKLVNIVNDFMNCDCYYSPFCTYLEKNISYHIINRRLQGWSPREISREFKRVYELLIYPGDVYSFLDTIIIWLEAIKRIARVHNINSTYNDCRRVIEKIEKG